MDPLVSVCIPTRDRPDGLARTISCIQNQTYRNLEIIISDNASSDARVHDIATRAAENDPRIKYIRQTSNVGALANFESLIECARGKYFLLAADDDRWIPQFIENCVSVLEGDSSTALCHMEVQYETSEGLFAFFAQGSAFYKYASVDPLSRVEHLLRHNYDNLIYGLFRRKAAFRNGRSTMQWIGRSKNEIPLLILAAERGNIIVLPEVGMIRDARLSVCQQARWECFGGTYPIWRGYLYYFYSLLNVGKYHALACFEIMEAIQSLNLPTRAKIRLSIIATALVCRHYLYWMIRWKPRRVGHNEITNTP